MAGMFMIQHILEDARRRLAILGRDSTVVDAAAILADSNRPLVVVCDADGVAVGVVSRMDIVREFGRSRDAAVETNVDGIMTAEFFGCREDQPLNEMWSNLNAKGLRCAPLLDDSGRPLGVVHARDIARALIDEVTHEELSLRDYVLGIGYR